MNIFKKAYCRLYQVAVKILMPFLSFHEPERISGSGASEKAALIIKEKGYFHPLLVVDPGVYALGLAKPVEDSLKKEGYNYALFTKVVPNPTFGSIYAAFDLAKKNNCDSLIAIGGGSSMDTAKAVGVLLKYPKKSLYKFKGVLKVHHKLPLLIAIPTTAGTGSEATVAAVVVDEKESYKFSINDPHLIPSVAILDDDLLAGLPPKIIGPTGMDALTHAVEAYIGHTRTKKTKRYSIAAVRLIYQNLPAFYADHGNQKARGAMQEASYLAGVSFTRSYVGYVHALAHALGGEYNVPHGLANAVILPYVLRRYGAGAEKDLARLSEVAGLDVKGKNVHEKAAIFINSIDSLNASLSIPKTFSHLIKPEDLDTLAERADKEANPLYPVPRLMGKDELKEILKEIDPA